VHFLIAIVTFFVGIVSCLGQEGTIYGRIYSESTKQPLTAAKLILKKDNVYAQKMRTDHAGNYHFGRLPEGVYTVWVSADDYCQLEMQRVVVDSQAIVLDLGLVEVAAKRNVSTPTIIYKQYEWPIRVELAQTTVSDKHQDFKNELNVINEVYEGAAIRIAPPKPPASPLPRHKATHFYEDFDALEKK